MEHKQGSLRHAALYDGSCVGLGLVRNICVNQLMGNAGSDVAIDVFAGTQGDGPSRKYEKRFMVRAGNLPKLLHMIHLGHSDYDRKTNHAARPKIHVYENVGCLYAAGDLFDFDMTASVGVCCPGSITRPKSQGGVALDTFRD